MNMKVKVRILELIAVLDLAFLLFLGQMYAAGGPAAPVSSGDEEAVIHRGYVALTFDDGPDRECTEDLLDGLKNRGVKASFFLMGQNIEGNEDLVLRMKEEGHLVGNHSYSHLLLTKADSRAVCQAVDSTSRLIQEITGEEPQYIRPPYGEWNEELDCTLDLTPVFWTVDSLDWKLKDRAQIVDRVLKDVEDGDIILMHDIYPQSVEAALEIVDRLSAGGYTFVTADELLID
ncbi:MAG TPA: polysaccharide deacetylase family protein [Candidatus Enterocloster excrementigallinarum]|uniref:Polysaccharide deacetylase family protein n=1 Tax=Candidatus Enterocloster excrementigallinarum TaxID=2838558 RepID=A0A9D2PR39_9FIRM|nr:polysaccharide deacetylase family protein [Candidatus Enterocloster excrementigallinarum]